jgi:amidohydrolase
MRDSATRGLVLTMLLGCGGSEGAPRPAAALPEATAVAPEIEVPAPRSNTPQIRTLPIPRFAAIEPAALAVEAHTLELRRTIHHNPELGEREHETAALVASELGELDLEVRAGIAGTGVIGVLRGGKPGATVAWRADMDALPIRERTGLPFASEKTDTWENVEVGVMHACGHDLHTAIALGLARMLASPAIREQLAGTVVFVFQPAEEGLPDEGIHGARRIVEEGALRELAPQAILALHVDPKLEVGTVATIAGGALAASDRFEIGIVGKGSHGAYPQFAIDPIVVAAELVFALQTIASRTVDPRDTVVVTVGQIAAGNRYNIIPERAELVGTIRTHDTAVQQRVHERVRELANGVAAAHGARAEVMLRSYTPVTVNDAALFGALRPVLVELLGPTRVIDDRPHMGAEDFAYYAKVMPGFYFFLGVGDPAVQDDPMTHTDRFVADERALGIGLRAAATVVLTVLSDAAAVH